MYETPDPPSSSEANNYEDDSQSESVDKLECGVGKSYDNFKDKTVDNQNTGNLIITKYANHIMCKSLSI